MTIEMDNIVERLQNLRQNGRPIIACFPLYPPLELMHAMGLVPIVLWGLKGVVPHTAESDRHLQTYTCSVARHLAQFLLKEGKNLIDGIFMYNACDTLRNLPEIFLKDALPSGRPLPLIRMHIPMTSQHQTNVGSYFENEIHSIIESFQSHFGATFSPDQFGKSIHQYNRMKKLACKAAENVAKGHISFQSFTKIMMQGWFLPVEEQIKAIELLIGDVSGLPETSPRNAGKINVVISGILPPPDPLISAIENAGLTIAGNDIASMGRYYANIHESPADPVEYYKKFYFEHHPCPTLLYTGDRRLESLMNLIELSRSRGVIFVGEKFCEYEYFEFPYVEKLLKKNGVQTLNIEIAIEDTDQTAAHQARIESFAEMMK